MTSREQINVGKAVAARVGLNIREVRTNLSLTQSQLAAPEFSISYISAIERGKIRPSLLAILAKRLDVPLTFLLEGSPAGAAEARAVGYTPADSGPDVRIDVDLLLARLRFQSCDYVGANKLIEPLQPDRARNFLGKAYFSLNNYTLALENHALCAGAISGGRITDLLFALDVFYNLADDYLRLGELEKSVTFYRKSLATIDGMKRDSRTFARTYMELGQEYRSAGQMGMAREYLQRSLAVYEMLKEQRDVGLVHQSLGKSLEKQNDLSGAESEYREALAIEEEMGNPAEASLCRTSLAEILMEGGNLHEAEQEAEAALTRAQSGAAVQAQAQALLVLAQLRNRADDYACADAHFSQALKMLEESGMHELAGVAYSRYAALLEEQGEVQRSLEAYKRAYQHQKTQARRGDFE